MERIQRKIDATLFDRLKGATASGFGMAGNLLDLPGSMIRDVVSGRNPFDQLLDPLSHHEAGTSVTGRQVLDEYGITQDNKETGISGWWDDPMEGVRDVGAFAFEMALDPLSWLTGGLAGAAVKGSRAVSAGTRAAGMGGKIKRAFQVAGDVSDAIDPGFHIGKSVGRTAKGAEAVKKITRTPGAVKALAAAQLAKHQRINDITEKAKTIGRQYFDAAAEGADNPLMQHHNAAVRKRFDKAITAEVTNDIEGVNGEILRHFGEGITSDQIVKIQKDISRAVESGNYSKIPPDIARRVSKVVENDDALHHKMQALGANPKWLADHVTDFSVRQMNHNLEQLAKDNRIQASGAAQAARGLQSREHLYRNGMKEDWNDLTADEDVHLALQVDDGGQAASKIMHSRYGNKIDPRMPVTTKKEGGNWKVTDENGNEFEVTGNPELYKMDYGKDWQKDPVRIVVPKPDMPFHQWRQYFDEDELTSALESSHAYKSRDKIVEMTPDEFLEMAEDLPDGPREESMTLVRELMENETPFHDIPRLGFTSKGKAAKVTSHEGRHRALALKEKGIDSMPVVLRGDIRWGEQVPNKKGEMPFDRVEEWPATLKGQTGGELPFPVRDPNLGPEESYLTVKTKDRFVEVARHLRESGASEELLEAGGIYNNDWIALNVKRQASKLKYIAELEEMPHLFAAAHKAGKFGPGGVVKSARGVGLESSGKTVSDMFNHGLFNGMRKEVILKNTLKNMYSERELSDLIEEMGSIEEVIEDMKEWRLDADLYRSMEARRILNEPEAIGAIKRAFNFATTVFKMGVLTHPARIGRDALGAQINNILNERFTVSGSIAAKQLATNQTAPDLLKIPEVQNWIVEEGLPGLIVERNPAILDAPPIIRGIEDPEVAAKSASEAMRRRYAAARTDTATVARNQPGVETGIQSAETFEDLREARPGSQQRSEGLMGFFADQFAKVTAADKTWKEKWNPLAITGLRKEGMGGRKVMRKRSGFVPASWSEDAQTLSDNWGRLTGIISGMQKGESFDDAFRATTFAQINYSPSNLSPALRKAKSWFPFLTFDNGMVRFLAHKLATKPTGLHGKVIRAEHRGEDKTAPEYIRRTGGVRLYDSPDGTSHYVTSLGMMHSGVLDKLGDGSLDGLLRGIGASVSPYIKAPFEKATGQSLFMNKPLTSLDPPMGRIVRNLQAKAGMDVPEGKAKPLGGHTFEFLMQNSPLSRVVGTVKKLTDTRRPFALSAFEQLSGAARLSTVSPWMRERERASQIEGLANQLGISEFRMTNVRKKDVENAADPETKQLLEAIRRYQSDSRKIKRKRGST